jgi:hypothetical protein
MILFGSGPTLKGVSAPDPGCPERERFFPDPNPDPAKSFGSDRIRIDNTGFGGTKEEKKEDIGRKIQCCGSAVVSMRIRIQGAKPMQIQMLVLHEKYTLSRYR